MSFSDVDNVIRTQMSAQIPHVNCHIQCSMSLPHHHHPFLLRHGQHHWHLSLLAYFDPVAAFGCPPCHQIQPDGCSISAAAQFLWLDAVIWWHLKTLVFTNISSLPVFHFFHLLQIGFSNRFLKRNRLWQFTKWNRCTGHWVKVIWPAWWMEVDLRVRS